MRRGSPGSLEGTVRAAQGVNPGLDFARNTVVIEVWQDDL